MKKFISFLLYFNLTTSIYANDISDKDIEIALDTLIEDQNSDARDLILPGGVTLATGAGIIRYNGQIDRMNTRLDRLDGLTRIKENATLRGKPAPLSTRSVDHLHGTITDRQIKTEWKKSILKKVAWLSLGITVIQGVDLILTTREIDELTDDYPELLEGKSSKALEEDVADFIDSEEFQLEN